MQEQGNLFDAPGAMTVSIAGRARQQLSKEQKAFNSLIRQIDKRRVSLAAWERAHRAYHQKYSPEMLPLQASLQELQLKLVHRLDQAATLPALNPSDRRLLSSIVADLAVALLSSREDDEVKAIHDKHSRSDYDADQAAAMRDVKAELETVLGFELPEDFGLDSPEEFVAQARAQMEAQEQARAQRAAKRKKSPQQLAREAQQQAEAKQITGSIREVYRKLASALHPDREVDASERARKTALMQRVNQAYESGNLLQLLELQLELEHINRSTIDEIGDEKLKYYNKVLKGQIADLDRELAETETRFAVQYGLSPFLDLSPDLAVNDLDMQIAGLREAIHGLEDDLDMLAKDKRVKKWLAVIRRERRSTMSFGVAF